MFTLFFAIVFGVGLSLFATQNTNRVIITIASTQFSNIPLWVIIVASILVGFVVAAFFNIVNSVTSKFKLLNKDRSIKGADKTISDLQNEIQELKEKNAELRASQELE